MNKLFSHKNLTISKNLVENVIESSNTMLEEPA